MSIEMTIDFTFGLNLFAVHSLTCTCPVIYCKVVNIDHYCDIKRSAVILMLFQDVFFYLTNKGFYALATIWVCWQPLERCTAVDCFFPIRHNGPYVSEEYQGLQL